MCCEGERQRQSDHSPSVVADGETVAYVLVQPDYYDGLKLLAQAFSTSKMTEGNFSVYRPEHCTVENVIAQVVVPLHARNEERLFPGCISAICRDIRAITQDDRRAVCVLDDGLPDFPAHATLGFSEYVRAQTRSVKIAVRANLCRVFGAYPDQLTVQPLLGAAQRPA